MNPNYDRTKMFRKAHVSVEWLRENYSHIWYHPDLTVDMKAGFLAACCDSRRCCLAQLSLHERVHTIRVALIEEGIP